MTTVHLNLEDAFQDSPQYRAKLLTAHKSAEAFESTLTVWAERARHFVEALAGLNEATDNLLQDLTTRAFTSFPDSKYFEDSGAKLRESFLTFESSFVGDLENGLIEPLLQFQKSSSQMLTEARRQFLNSAEDYESMIHKYSSLPHLKNQRKDEFTNYLYSMKLKSCRHSLSYANMLNELPLIRGSFVLNKMNSFLEIMSTLLGNHQLLVNNAKPVVAQALESIDEDRTIENIQDLQDDHTLLEHIEPHLTKYRQALGVEEYDEVSIATQVSDLSIDSDLMVNNGKSGYLLLRKANTRGGWNRHWFRIQMPEGLFIQCTNSSDQPIVVDLHASSVYETDCDGRSYAFEISTPPVSKYYFQAETELDMMEWVTALRVPHVHSINYNKEFDVTSGGSELVKSSSVYVREVKNSKNALHIKDPLSLPATWRRIVLIIRSNGTLYQFDEHDKTVIENIKIKELQRNQISLIDESALKKKCCFVLKSKQRAYFFMTEGLSERNEWVSILKTFAQPEVLGHSEPPHFCYRLDRACLISVIEGRGFGHADPYCYIELDGERRGKTSTKYRVLNPIWVEDFLFTDLPALRDGATVVVMNKNRIHKDSNIGKVHLPISVIRQDEEFEGWYPVMYESKISGYPAEMVGELRLRFKYDEVVVLPSSSYGDLLKLLLDVESRLIFDLVNVSKNLEWFAENMMRIYAAKNMAMEWLLFLARNEVEATDDANILFRGNSILTKAIDGYMKLIGLQYVDEAIGDIVRSICENKVYVEVDELKLDRNEDIRAHWRILIGYTKMLWKGIEKTQAKCPRELCVLFYGLRGIKQEK
ncbi:hypothetical protein K7432_012547 [Basidiobolus ranarum]|uniref:Uncharacterized protein n=1 Tax=Basidiobolus ranarum TaxID=34480 RepID=A0ABR2VS27_9FUNG